MTKNRAQLRYRELIPYYHFDQSTREWEKRIKGETQEIAHSMEHFTLFNFNVLFDMHYGSDVIFTEQRVPLILNILKECDADVIALQEVRPSFLQELVKQEWVQTKYFVSDVDGIVTLGEKYGQVMLTKLEPSALYIYRFSNWKSVLLPCFTVLINGIRELMLIPILHLSSGKHSDAPKQRKEQITCTMFNCENIQADHILLVGDFNMTDDDEDKEDEQLTQWGRDAWQEVYDLKESPGYTLDPTTNPIAYATIVTGKDYGRRLDRIFIRSDQFIVESIGIKATEKYTILDENTQEEISICASDHYALECKIAVNQSVDRILPPIPRKKSSSMLALILPEEVWPQFERIQKKHLSVQRYGPHITLANPFLPEHMFDRVVSELSKELNGFEPFELTFDVISSTGTNKKCMMYIEPKVSPPNALVELHAQVLKLYPHCTDIIKRSGKGYFVPAINLGLTHTPNETKKWIKLYQSTWTPITVTIKELCLLSRAESGPYQIQKIIPLGTHGTNSI